MDAKQQPLALEYARAVSSLHTLQIHIRGATAAAEAPLYGALQAWIPIPQASKAHAGS